MAPDVAADAAAARPGEPATGAAEPPAGDGRDPGDRAGRGRCPTARRSAVPTTSAPSPTPSRAPRGAA